MNQEAYDSLKQEDNKESYGGFDVETDTYEKIKRDLRYANGI